MMLQALTAYYEALAAKGVVSRPGWSREKLSYALELDADGRLLRVTPLRSPSADGKKLLPRPMEVPMPVKRTAGVQPNFLWDNAAYLLGLDGKGKPERARECYEAAKALHLQLLQGEADPFAAAVRAYFAHWSPEDAPAHPALRDALDELLKGANLVFRFDGAYPAENAALRRVWQAHYDGEAEGERMRCLVTGETVAPEKVHPSIKNVYGAQSSGAALVSFNAPAFCSYEREQNLNAPVGRYAAFAYTTALNLLLSDSAHVRRYGDTTLVFWAEDGEPVYQDAFAQLLDGGGDTLQSDALEGFMDAIVHGRDAHWASIPLAPRNRFFILGLAPNAARLSVRFFLRDTFGGFVEHIQRHYADIRIAPDRRSSGELPLWALLRETVNLKSTDKSPLPQMAGDTLRAILTGVSYPATLYQQTQLRIRAERELTRGRMAIVKGYLTRYPYNEAFKEALQVELNEQTLYQPYVLGRVFAVLESIQQAANPGINTTIKDRYFTSACATPAVVFPTLLNLAQKHLKTIGGKLSEYYQKQLTQLLGGVTAAYPAHHSLYDQGVFQLGYYHQRQKQFAGKTTEA